MVVGQGLVKTPCIAYFPLFKVNTVVNGRTIAMVKQDLPGKKPIPPCAADEDMPHIDDDVKSTHSNDSVYPRMTVTEIENPEEKTLSLGGGDGIQPR